MSKRDWLLIFCAYHGAPQGLDPVRLQKGMFLFSRTAQSRPGERYDFRPYDYGPMSAAIYHDLDKLVDEGLLEQHPVAGKRWSRYTPTSRGRAAAQAKLKSLKAERDRSSAKVLYDIKQEVAGVSFNDLLERVYDEHPDMAVNSVFRSPDE